MADEKPRIIVDEDWKAQVQREKEEQQKEAPKSEADTGPAQAEGALPEASFPSLITSLAAQAVYALGLLPSSAEGQQVRVDLGQGKYIIDTLVMLREKTQGHLTPEESGQLNETIAELQRAYVVRAQQAQDAAMAQAGIKPKPPGSH